MTSTRKNKKSEAGWKVTCSVCTFINDLRLFTADTKLCCSVCGSKITLKPENMRFLTGEDKGAGGGEARRAAIERLAVEPPTVMDQKNSFLLSIIGFPDTWCLKALQRSGGEPIGAIQWLLDSKEALVSSDFRTWKSFNEGKFMSTTKLPASMRNITATREEAQAPTTNPCFHILNYTWETMVVSNLDQKNHEKGGGSAADGSAESKARVAAAGSKLDCDEYLDEERLSALEDFLRELEEMAGEAQISSWIEAEQGITVMSARECMVKFLKNMPSLKSSYLFKVAKNGEFTQFLKTYVKSAKWTHPDKDPLFSSAVFSSSILRALQTELVAVSSEAKQGYPISETRFRELAPIGSQLSVLVLDQLVHVYRTIFVNRDGGKASSVSVSPSNRHLVVASWGIDVFLQLVDWVVSSGNLELRKDHMQEVFSRLFSSHLVDGLVGLIIAMKGDTRTSMMQLLASVNNSAKRVLRLSLSQSKRQLLQSFMFRTYQSQRRTGRSGCFSPFFQALVELNVSIHFMQKVSERKLYTNEKGWFQDVLQVAECMQQGSLTDDIQLQVWRNIARSDDLTDFLRINNQVFTRECDVELVTLVNRVYIKKGARHPTKAHDLKISRSDMVQFPNMQARNIRQKERTYRFHVLETLNRRIHTLIPLVNLSVPPGQSSLADGIRSIRSIMFWSTKGMLWTEALRQTRCIKREVCVTIDKIRAIKCKQEHKVDIQGTESIFGQTMNALHHQTPRIFRIGPNERAFKVTEVGFNSQDIGGPYRDTIEALVKELESSVLPLFVPCVNSRLQMGRNQDVWVPNTIDRGFPQWQKDRVLSMYEFVGKLMGLAIRSINYLSFHFSEVVWKPLVWDRITVSDITAIDALAFRSLQDAKYADRGKFAKMFSHTKFVSKLANGQTVELVENGAKKSVTWQNKKHYFRALSDFKLGEFRKQADAMRRGLATVVPYQILSLFTWQDLQDHVCGRISVDVKLLQNMTRYAGSRRLGRGFVTRNSPHVRMFWKMMHDKMDNFQRSKLIFFVWGRSRLPVNKNGFERHFTIMAHASSHALGRNPDNYLPVAHTCFFQLELPEYSNIDIMYEKVMYACTHCTSIDGDNTAAARAAARRSGFNL